MKATFQISEQDYVNAMKLFGKITPVQAAIYSLIVLLLVMLVVFGSQVLRGGAIGGLIGAITTILVMRYIVTPIFARRHYRKYKAIQEQFTVELLDDGVKFTSPDAEGKITWGKIHKWRQNEYYLLIYPMPRLFHIIPKSVAEQGFDFQKLTDELVKHIGQPA